jgi:C1A family cysteine protease
MTILGYDIPGKTLLAKNSFGTDWGDQGYCLVPFEYLDAFVFETWCFDIKLS